jgi:translation initiation factor eIF-2B subunit delta
MEAHDKKMKFRVIIADAGPEYEGRQLVKTLSSYGIKVTYVLLSGLSFLIDKVTKVFIGASSVLSNGAVIAKIGNSMLTTIARKHQKPVVVFSETYKFSDRVNLDPININEIGNPQALLNQPSIRSKVTVILFLAFMLG